MKHLASRDNATFRTLLALATDRRARRAAGQTLLEGEHLLGAALHAGHPPRLLVFDAQRAETLAPRWCARLPQVPAVSLAAPLLRALSALETPAGVLALADIPAAPAVPAAGLLLLEDIQDPGNLGAILRVAAAAGVTRVALSAGCAEVWSPKALRGGQGAQFRLAVQEGAELPALALSWPGPVYAGLPGACRSLYDLELRGEAGFAFGNEGAGLGAALQAVCQPFAIPMPGGMESLNVATAVAVCLFEAVRQRAQGPGRA